MNRTAFAARLTDSELAAEITMYEVEQVEHRNDADWSGYNMLHALLAEQETRRAAAVDDSPAAHAAHTAAVALADTEQAAAELADFDTWLWSLPEGEAQAAAEQAALADMQHYGWEDGRPVEVQQAAA